MQSVVRSVNGARLQTAQLMGLPLVIPAHSTLNEKFNIQANVSVPEAQQPHLKYVTIGNGGHKMVTGTGGISRPVPIQHKPRDNALYNHLPFVLRAPGNDLTALERSKYRLRTSMQLAGINYSAYYLKELDLSDTGVETNYYTVADGVTTASAFSPNSGDLNPTPPDLTNTGVVETTGDYIAASARVPFVMTTDEMSEFMNVCNLIYGDPSYAIISEIGLCSGVDKVVSGTFDGVAASYTEAIGVQIASFISAFFAAQFSNTGVNLMLDVGSVEPMLTLS